MMNRTSLLAMVIGAGFTVPVLAYDGMIQFNGNITDNTCEISINGGGSTETVNLPRIPASALNSAGVTDGETPFTIALNNCSGSTLVSAYTYFEGGTYVDLATGRLNTASVGGAAENVQIELLDNTSQAIVVGDQNSQSSRLIDISSGSGSMDYIARYYASDAVTAGTVYTSVNYSIIYL
ncbi:fimbrial protein [Entomohabitans teleogrylli]|uniref:fimbrial protein n=1 Tax=Entomohabitans teleogrylli TaxID=1384589 RepID=UPI000A69DAEA|nr:fimbrial protein [Entomohabitans teleogrylli]